MQTFADLKSWAKSNMKLVIAVVTVLASMLGTMAGVKFIVEKGPPGSSVELHLFLPSSFDPVVWQQEKEAAKQAAPGGQNEMVVQFAGEWSLVSRAAIGIAIYVLERRSPKTETEWDDRLLQFLKLIAGDRAKFEKAYGSLQTP